MDYVGIGLLCLLLGGAMVWQLWVKKLQSRLDLCQINRKELETRLKTTKRGYDTIVEICKAIYTEGFGPFGTNPQTKTNLFNQLWGLLGKPEKGVP
jgi:hypothetical protein